jgi:Arc/MetJ-type ribon-helix-helix transcriptional regulator
MVIALPPESEILVQNQVENGNYENRSIGMSSSISQSVRMLRFFGLSMAIAISQHYFLTH